jgi:hypothetical protein
MFSSGIVIGARSENDRQHGHRGSDEDRFCPRPARDVTDDRSIQLSHDTAFKSFIDEGFS